MAMFASRPTSAFGYWRGGGNDLPLSSGHGYGPTQQGAGLFMQGQGPPGGGSAWTPTLTYLLVLVIAEMIAFKILERMLR
jgi:hypothetical protein